MITSRIRIEGDSKIYDMYQKFGFIYKDSDTIFSPPEKKRDTTSYAGSMASIPTRRPSMTLSTMQ